MLTVRKRVTLATNLIHRFDDPQVIDREMRFLRPFWEFIQTRQKLNRQRYWKARQKDLFTGISKKPVRQTPLIWLPHRDVICSALDDPNGQKRAIGIGLLRGLDIVIFNFSTLLSRSHYALGIQDPESFQLVTSEPEEDGSYQCLRSTLHRRSAENNEEYKIITTRFILPDQEEIKIEKDFSRSTIDPDVLLRVTADRSGRERGPYLLEYRGRQSELNQRTGRLKVSRL
ncbi:MAG: hypothetical protein HUJ26_06800 [Planctomycetaceae bacterium]|nr:hypothetical protein [Planctomycetaceae bacterium]